MGYHAGKPIESVVYCLNKPVYVGQAVLDLSKILFDFHYNYIREKYKGGQAGEVSPSSRANLLFTDTDSLLYLIHTDDFYKDISHDFKTHFDTSDYPPDHPSGILSGVKLLGYLKTK